jgi:hypothetical protein
MSSRIKFSQLSDEKKMRLCTIPQHVFVTQNPDDETREQVILRQDRFIELPQEIKSKLSSPDTGKKIQEIGRSFYLELLQTASIARSVRNFYFGDVRTENFFEIYEKEMKVSSEVAKKIAQAVVQKIIQDDTIEKEYQAQFEEIVLKDALKKYEELGEQLVTSSHIKLKNFPEPVRPSIKNWLSDYNFNLGFESHDAMGRGTYLFQNENAKVLSGPDRQKLAHLFKAYDENIPVKVNITAKQIVFPDFENKTQSNATPESLKNEEVESKTQPMRITPRGFGSSRNDFPDESPQSKHIVNLKK